MFFVTLIQKSISVNSHNRCLLIDDIYDSLYKSTVNTKGEAYWISQQKYTENQGSEINRKAQGKARMKAMQPGLRKFASRKWSSDYIVTGKNMVSWKLRH